MPKWRKGEFDIIKGIVIFSIDNFLWVKHVNWYEFFPYYKKKSYVQPKNKNTKKTHHEH
jgi:hypothetical protein